MIESVIRCFRQQACKEEKIKRCEFVFECQDNKLQRGFVDLTNQEVVNPSQSDEIFKEISKNEKIVRNEGSKAHSKYDSAKSII